MEMLIKTENAAQFIAENFISPNIRCGGVDLRRIVESETKDEVLISKKSGLNESDTLIIHHRQRYNDRCSVDEQLTYRLTEHDSVSVKGALVLYRPVAVVTEQN